MNTATITNIVVTSDLGPLAASATATLTGPTSGSLNTKSTAFTVTLDAPAGPGGVVVNLASTLPDDIFWAS